MKSVVDFFILRNSFERETVQDMKLSFDFRGDIIIIILSVSASTLSSIDLIYIPSHHENVPIFRWSASGMNNTPTPDGCIGIVLVPWLG